MRACTKQEIWDSSQQRWDLFIMNLQDYLILRKRHEEFSPQFRKLCTRCIQPLFSCYCGHIQRFDPKIDFVILIHPIEVRRRIATGRMSFLCLENSKLIRGQDYSEDFEVNKILADENRHCVILYPGYHDFNDKLNVFWETNFSSAEVKLFEGFYKATNDLLADFYDGF